MQDFRPGFLSMIKGTAAPVVPVYLGGLWGSIFSFEGGRFFWKWPRRVPYPVSIHFGPARGPGRRRFQRPPGRRALGDPSHATAIEPRNEPAAEVPAHVPPAMRRSKVADSTGADLTGAELLMGTLVLRRLLRRDVLDRGEQNVGVLLPPSVGSVLANAALAIDRRMAVNLNYTVSSEVMNQCIAQCGIRHVLDQPAAAWSASR